jgi:hypothetical protein
LPFVLGKIPLRPRPGIDNKNRERTRQQTRQLRIEEIVRDTLSTGGYSGQMNASSSFSHGDQPLRRVGVDALVSVKSFL